MYQHSLSSFIVFQSLDHVALDSNRFADKLLKISYAGKVRARQPGEVKELLGD